MKKLLLILTLFISLFISFNVYAGTYTTKKYVVKLNDEYYTVALPFEKTNYGYSLDYTQITLTTTDGKVIKYNSTVLPEPVEPENSFYDFMGEVEFSRTPNRDCLNTNKDFTEEEFNNDEYIKKFYPTFFIMDYDNSAFNGNVFAVAVDQDKISLEKYFEDLNNYMKTDISFSQKTTGVDDKSDVVKDLPTQTGGELKDNYWSKDIEYSKDEYIKRAQEIQKLLYEASQIKVCTEDDLNAIRSQRHVDFLVLDKEFDAALSDRCYNVLFGKDALYSKIIASKDDIMKIQKTKRSRSKVTMSFLVLETAYLQGFSFLTGVTMQEEINEVKACSIFGEKTYDILSYAFSLFKYAGLILGSILVVVDVFKAVVQKEDSGKKQFKKMSKRIIAIVLLFITPVLVEIIFEFISSIGVTDPICGIR